MKDIKLKYNPYTREKELSIDGIEIKDKDLSNFCGAEGKELSDWSGAFFDALYRKCNSDFSVRFSGITRDKEFLEDSLKIFKGKNPDIEVNLIEESICSVEDKLGELKSLFIKMQAETPFVELKSEELTNIFNDATDSDFEMAVVATMSSGKSTLINALLGQELLPARNEATTATLARIHDDDNANHFCGVSYDINGNKLKSCDPLTSENMEELNNIDENPTERIEIYGNIPGIESKNIKLVLTDTPGPNNSRTDEHKKHTYSLLDKDYKPMILYVLNGTQLATNDDNALLNYVAKAMKTGDRQSQDRFIFVLNKADAFDPKKESITQAIDKVRAYLADHGISNARIFPCSSLIAKLIRQYQNNLPLTEDEEDTLNAKYKRFITNEDKHFSRFADFLSNSTKVELERRIQKAKDDNNDYEEALLYTGIPSIELAISEYLTKYALPAKISKGVYTFKDKIADLGIEAAEKETLRGNENKVIELSKNLEEIEKVLANGKKADLVKDKINKLSVDNEVKAKFEQCRGAFTRQFADATRKMNSSEIATDVAQIYVNNLQNLIPDMCLKFNVDIQKILDDVLKSQAQDCVNEYKKYVEDLIGSVDYKLKPASVLGEKASITIDDTLYQYKETRERKVGEHQERNDDYHWYDGIGNFFKGIFGGDKKEKFITYDDMEEYDVINFADFLETKVQPKIRDFFKTTSDIVNSFAKDEEQRFKKFFMCKLDELDTCIKNKIKEQKETLKNKESLNQMIDKNKDNLAWLNGFKNDLDNLLSI